jgi:large subunit ribosomal protein L7/L12
VLLDAGTDKISVIEVIQALTNLKLRAAKELSESPEATIERGISEGEAEQYKRNLEAAGATAKAERS